MSREGEKYHFQKGGGINIVFGPKYRPLLRPQPSEFLFNRATLPSFQHFSTEGLYINVPKSVQPLQPSSTEGRQFTRKYSALFYGYGTFYQLDFSGPKQMN